MHQVNVDGTLHVLQACQNAQVKVLVYTSSMEVVSGILPNGQLQLGGTEECDYPIQHFLSYAATKAQAEQCVLNSNHHNDLHTVALRPGYIVGPGCIGVKMEILRAFQYSWAKPRYITARVPCCISCVHVKNCAIAHVLAAQQAMTCPHNVCGKAFFIRDFDCNTVEVATFAFEDSPIQVVILPFWLAYGIAWIADRIDRFFHWICGLLGTTWATSDNVIDIHAVDLGYHDFLVSSKLAQSVLGYGDAERGPKLIGKDECFQQTRQWAHDFIRQQQQQQQEKQQKAKDE